MTSKKFFKYDMRDEFSFPVYVSKELVCSYDIKGIPPEKRIAGEIIRKNGQTSLNLACIPRKTNINDGIIFNAEDQVFSQDDSKDWYATTWDGNISFVLHKYFRIKASSHMSFNNFSMEVSRWRITDFRMVSQFMLEDKVYSAKLYLDHIYSWFNLVTPESDLSSIDSLKYEGLKYKNRSFSLKVCGEKNQAYHPHSFNQTAQLYILLEFKDEQNEEFVYNLAVVIRDMFRVLFGVQTGISRIILNNNMSYNAKKKELSPKDQRENWFLEQTFLPSKPEKEKHNFNVKFSDIEGKFQQILEQYFCDEKLQRLINTFVTVDYYNTPVSTEIVTLISGIDTYYNQAKFSGGKKIKSAAKKLQRFVDLIDEPEMVLSQKFDGSVNIESMLTRLLDSRDYFVHGDKSDKFTTEVDLIPDLIKFKFLFQQILVNLISLEVIKKS